MAKIAPRGSLDTVFLENKPTYRYAVSAFAAVATPTDVVVITGSATAGRRVIVKRIKIEGAATAAGNMPVTIIRRSTVGTIGSAVLTAVVPAKMDSTDPTASAVVSTVGTANYTTPGTAAGLVDTGRVQMTALATGLGVTPYQCNFADRLDKPVVLRGVAELLCINLNGAAIPAGGVLDITIEIEEDDGI